MLINQQKKRCIKKNNKKYKLSEEFKALRCCQQTFFPVLIRMNRDFRGLKGL